MIFSDVNIFLNLLNNQLLDLVSLLDYYLSTCCGGPSFVLAYLCKRYSWGFIIIQ